MLQDETGIEMDDIEDFKTDKEYYPGDEVDTGKTDEVEEAKRQAVRDELDTKTGRLWEDRWEFTDEDWSTGKSFEDLADWTEEICSRVSRDRVQVYPGESVFEFRTGKCTYTSLSFSFSHLTILTLVADGVPTLGVLASLPLPLSTPTHPALGDPNPYVKHRKNAIFNSIYDAVEKFAEPKVEKILATKDWNEKQDAIDDLFEQVHDGIKKRGDGDDDYISVVLGSQPTFPRMVEQALEKYLRSVVRDEKESFDENKDGNDEDDSNPDESAVPVFMDLMKSKGASLDSEGVPKAINPLKKHPNDGVGRMLEEWELSANDKTRRIMIRQCTRDIARVLNEGNGSRVFVTGRKGAGKTAALASIVASARESGHIVMYLPDGDRLRRNGYYVEANSHRATEEGKLFDLPLLSQEVCGQLMESHSKDLGSMSASKEVVEKIISADQLKKVHKAVENPTEDESIPLNDLLKIGNENVGLAAACYGAVVDVLMTQTSTPFTIVVDQFNCMFDRGHYFHGDFDRGGEKAIPIDRITLFKPLTDAMGVMKTDGGDFITKDPVPMKVGGFVAGITESHAVTKKCTKDLTDAIAGSGATCVDVPQYSALEVEHILANFEIIGIGRLRFDRGETVMNNQEVAYLRMVSGAVGQPLLDACVH